MTHQKPNADAIAYNAAWKAQQKVKQQAGQQKPDNKPCIGVPAADKTAAIHPGDTPVMVPVDAITSTTTVELTSKRFLSFLKTYKLQVKAKQVKPILVRKQGEVFILIDGGRRLAAARVLKFPTISAIVQEQV
jgi:hypothetical protein